MICREMYKLNEIAEQNYVKISADKQRLKFY